MSVDADGGVRGSVTTGVGAVPGGAVLRPDDRDQGARHSHVWFGSAERPLHGWVSVPAGGLARGGVVLCPPMGEEGRASHRTFRRLAEEGLVALRFDYDGTGDSAGAQDDPDRVAAWLASVEAARTFVAGLGVGEVSAVGMRLGATLAGCQAVAAAPFDSLVLWDPCLSGRTFLREGQALYAFSEGIANEPPADGMTHTPGFQYDAATARAMRGLDLGKLSRDQPLARRVLLLGREDRPVADAIAARVAADPAEATVEPALDQDRLLDLLPSDNFVPERTLLRIVEWLGEGAGDLRPVDAAPAEGEAVVPSGGPGSASVREHVVRLGPAGVLGIATEPLQAPATGGPRPWVVLVNVAAEHHIGPGRKWVEWARAWAAMGYRCIRLDQSGIGDSPTRPRELEDQPFAPEWIDDMREVVAALGADGSAVSMVGLCSGAYSACEAALWSPPGAVAGIMAINPRLTLYPAARGTAVWTDRRRAARVPVRPVAWLARRWRNTAGGIWRIYRQVALWHAPTTVLPKVLRRGTTLRVITCRMDAREFTEVALVWPLLALLRRRRTFSFEVDDVFDHSLLTRAGQRLSFERSSDFVREMHGDATWSNPS